MLTPSIMGSLFTPIYPQAFARLNLVETPWIQPEIIIYENQFRFPKSKCKRIRKKWAKDKRNFRPVRTSLESVYLMAGQLLCSPRVGDKLKQLRKMALAKQPTKEVSEDE